MTTRNTTQRIKILNYLQSVKTHPNAESIYHEVKKDLPSITLATVYRNLHILSNEGKILKLEINNELRFDGDISSDVHCYCNRCGKILDLSDEEITKYLSKPLKNFISKSVQIIHYGHCKRCKGG